MATLLLGIFWTILAFNHLVEFGFTKVYDIGSGPNKYLLADIVADAGFSILPIILLLVAPAKAISRRLIFLALGLLLLIALNELSKLGLDLTAPK